MRVRSVVWVVEDCVSLREWGVGCCQCICGECWVWVSARKLAGSAGEHSLGFVWCGEVAAWGAAAGIKDVEGRRGVSGGGGKSRVLGLGAVEAQKGVHFARQLCIHAAATIK